MGIAIQGIKLNSLSIDHDAEDEEKVTGKYSLISTADKVLAKQSFNSYGEIKVDFSSDTKALLTKLLAAVKLDIQTTLGLEES